MAGSAPALDWPGQLDLEQVGQRCAQRRVEGHLALPLGTGVHHDVIVELGEGVA